MSTQIQDLYSYQQIEKGMRMSKKKIRFGIFGLGRGATLIGCIRESGAEVTAICDYRPAAVAMCREEWFRGQNVEAFTDFELFIHADFDVVLLGNYFCDHAGFAIAAMRAGKHVLSETISNITMAQGVALCRAKEETGMTYALLENYPYFKSNLEMKRLYKEGTLGSLVYAEGEYVHPMSMEEQNSLAPGERHWRNWTPRTYYTTHALAPLMQMTDSIPTRVTAFAAFQPEIAAGTALRTGDAAAIILCQTDTNAVFRITGWACYAPHGNWYRLCCTRGGVEVNHTNNNMMLTYNDWCVPEGKEAFTEYEAQWPDPELGQYADNAGHGGGDFMVINHFIRCLENGEEPYWNVYRATTTASVAILAWRSVLDGGKPYDIPDFRKEEDRLQYENDSISPYPDELYKADIPCSSQPYTPGEEDLQTAREMWKNADYLVR